MLRIVTTPTFDRWIDTVPAKAAQLSIAARITRLEAGDLRNLLAVGEGILQLQVDHGDGFRIYLSPLAGGHGNGFTVLSGSDDFATHSSSITEAATLAARFEE